LGETAIEEELRRRVIELIGRHRLDQADVVHHAREIRQQFREFRTALPILREFEPRPHHRRIRANEGVPLIADDRWRERFAFELCQFGFVIEEIELRWRSRP
jgi:hypothetical protein